MEARTWSESRFSRLFLIGIFIDLVNPPEDWIVGMRLFRGPFLIILFLFLLSINLYVLKNFNINYVKIFKLKGGNKENHFKKILAISLLLFAVYIVSLSYFIHPSIFNVSIPRYTVPLILYGFMALILILLGLTDHSFWMFTIGFKTILAPVFIVREG